MVGRSRGRGEGGGLEGGGGDEGLWESIYRNRMK